MALKESQSCIWAGACRRLRSVISHVLDSNVLWPWRSLIVSSGCLRLKVCLLSRLLSVDVLGKTAACLSSLLLLPFFCSLPPMDCIHLESDSSSEVGTFLGGILGTSSVTTYGESMAGVYEGGRTGLTALVIAFLNFLCIFLTPLFSAIPTLSTGPALVMVGVFMIEGVKDIEWGDYMQAIPSTICILLQITTYHIEYGAERTKPPQINGR